MKKKVIVLFIIMFCISCKTDKKQNVDNQNMSQGSEMAFDKGKWETKDGKDYPFRDSMINDIVYNDTIRNLNKDQVLDLLGEPDYIREDHLYYRITETRLGNWPLKTKTMVIKLEGGKAIEWIKIHE